MEYKSIVERNCEDAFRHYEEAKKIGGVDRIAAAHQNLKRALDIAREVSPALYAKYIEHL